MELVHTVQNNTLQASLQGKFTFSDNQAFREVLEKIAQDGITRVVFDMSKVEFVDSAALGMLLLAHDEAAKHDKSLVISGIKGQVEKMFKVARFDAMFTLQNTGS